jgi:hypothetical protein
MQGKKRNIRAQFYPDDKALEASKLDMDSDYNKLVRNLVLCKNAKVMINQNVNVGIGLANGSLGTVYDFAYEGTELVYILVQMNEK